jgi:hypothetical protein
MSEALCPLALCWVAENPFLRSSRSNTVALLVEEAPPQNARRTGGRSSPRHKSVKHELRFSARLDKGATEVELVLELRKVAHRDQLPRFLWICSILSYPTDKTPYNFLDPLDLFGCRFAKLTLRCQLTSTNLIT